MRLGRACVASTLLLALGGGCSTDTPTEERKHPLLSLNGEGGCSPTTIVNQFYYLPVWGCNADVRVTGPSGWALDIQGAVEGWNGALGHGPAGRNLVAPGLPRLVWQASGSTEITVVDGGGGGGYYCGATNIDPPNPPSTITVYRRGSVPATPCVGNASPSLESLLRHELMHVLGVGNNHFAGADDIPLDCVVRLPADKNQVNGEPCQHELEVIYAGHGYRQIDIANFWIRPIVTGFAGLPAAITLALEEKDTLSVTGFLFARQASPPVGTFGTTSLKWVSESPTIAAVSSLQATVAEVTAEDDGSTRVLVSIQSGAPASHLVGTVLALGSHPVGVTVPTPPPPPAGGFRVSDIVGVATPFTTAQPRTVSATVVNAPTGTLLVKWKVTYSNGVLPEYETGYGANSHTLQVPEGSYYINVRATPKVHPDTGAAYVERFTVCTEGGGGGGGQFFVVPPPGTDAVEGC
jgi:hypothetical protein